MRCVPAVSTRQFGAFTTGQALRTGWTSHALRHAVGTDFLERVRPGVYAARDRPAAGDARTARLQLEAAAASLANRRLTLASSAAAALSEIALVTVPPYVCATYTRGRRGPMPGVHRHRGRLHPGHLVGIGPLLLTSPARTVVDLARECGLGPGVVAVDSAVRAGLTSIAQLDTMLGDCAGWPGVRAARRAVAFADPRAESALESLSRLRIAQAALPAPESQTIIRTQGGRFLGRVDFFWAQFGVVGEADGARKYDVADEDDSPLRAQNVRQGHLEDTGLIVVRWGWSDLAAFAATARRLENAFARALWPDRGPRLWRAEPTAWPQLSAAG